MQQYTTILFKLPDGRVVLQRRTKDAPYAPGKLGIFGGYVEDGETPDQCLLREIDEETNLNAKSLKIKTIGHFIIPANEDFEFDRQFFLYQADIASMDFEVYEGDGAEAYLLSELAHRADLTLSAQYAFTKTIAA